MTTDNLVELIKFLLEDEEGELDFRLDTGQVFESDGTIVTL